LTGAALRRQFQVRIRQVQWQAAPLRQAVESLSSTQHVAVLLDRRVDPNQPLDLELTDVPLGDVCLRIAQSRNLAVVPIGPVVYFGPADEVPKLETALELCRREVQRLPADGRRRWMETRPLAWSDLAVPREFLTRLAEENHIKLIGVEQVPHDLWAAADLPPLTLVDRLGLIAGQFGLMLEFDVQSRGAALVPIPNDVAVVESYPAGRQPEQLVRRWAELVPQCRLEIVDGNILVRGLLRDHRRLAASQKPALEPKTTEPPAGPAGATRYTIGRAQGTLGHLLEELSRRLGLELKIDRAALSRAGISLDQPVSLSVHEASREELFRALLEPAGCTFRFEGQTLQVQPAR
jgi:hypothetical protein